MLGEISPKMMTRPIGVIPTVVQAANYSAQPWDFVPCDPSGGGFTVTLPASPPDETMVGIKIVVAPGSNTVTIQTSGSDVINVAGGSTTGTLVILNQTAIFQYCTSKQVWYVISTDLPLGQLDARYFPLSGAATLTGAQQLVLSGDITPTALSGDVNDYNPTGLLTALTIRQDGGAADRNITGLAGGTSGRVIRILNIGATNNLILKNLSGSSSAANQFNLPADTTLPINTAIALEYDGTSSTWRPWSRSLSNTGVTAGTYRLATVTVDAAGRVTAISANPRITSITSNSTPTPNADTTDQYEVTALAVGATFGAPTGSPGDGQVLFIRITDNGSAQTIAWNAIYHAGSIGLPNTTILGKTMYVGFKYRTPANVWDCLAYVDNIT